MDSKITDIYLNLYNKKGGSKKVQITDLYEQVITKQMLEEAMVSIEFSDGKVKSVEMDDAKAGQLLKLSDVDINESVIDEWVSSGGWDTSDAQFLLRQKLITIYNNTIQLSNAGIRKEFYNQVRKITEFKKANKFSLLRQGLDAGDANIYSLISTKLKGEFNLLVNEDSLRQIGRIAFAEGAVGVGPGEALISLFTEGKNPDRGDIVLPDGDEVELKASNGRPGKARVTALVKRFETYVQQGHNVVELSPNDIDAATKAIEALKPKVQSPTNQAGRDILAIINNNTKSVEYVTGFLVNNKARAIIIQKLDPIAYKTLEAIGKQILTNTSGASKRGKSFFASASDKDLIKGLSLFSSKGKNIATSIIRKGLDQGSNMDRVDLALGIAMTFQIAEYFDELKQKFTYYTLFNKDSGLMITWGPFSNDYVTNANNILANILSNRDNIVISADSGGRTGYNLSIK